MDKEEKFKLQQQLVNKLYAENEDLKKENAELKFKLEVDNESFKDNVDKLKNLMHTAQLAKDNYEQGLKEIEYAKEEYNKSLKEIFILKKKYKEEFKKISRQI